MTFRIVYFQWDEKMQVMRPLARFHNQLSQYVDGEMYPLEVREQRSSKAHAFYFASVNSAWKNLRGQTAEILSTPEHLRKWALIMAGWYDQTIVPASSRDGAMKMAAWARLKDDHAEITIIKHDGEWYLRIREAKSQSRASMNKNDFTQSSRDVLDILAGTIEVTRKTLEREGAKGSN